MKLRIIILYLALAVSTLFWTACESPQKQEEATTYGEATMELVEMVNSNPELKSLLEASIAQAKAINPDKSTNPVQSLEEYYEFLTWGETSMPWTLVKGNDYPKLYDNMMQSLLYFYFLVDQPLAQLEDRENYLNHLQYSEPFRSWLVTYTRAWGQYLDTEASWNDDYHQLALKDDKFGLNNHWYEDASNWKTFNDFFSRRLKSPDQRPVTAPEDDAVVVSPADAVPQGVWEIDENSMIVSEKGVPVKTMTLHSIETLLGEGSAYGTAFANGTFTHTFLSVEDYHRYHFPVSGEVKEVQVINEQVGSGAVSFWDAENNRYAFDPSNIGWQSAETRGCVILETDGYGLVAVMPIGMAVVSSVNFHESVQVGARVNKGDELGHFLFGGSDFILVFQEQAGFVLEAPKDPENDMYYQHMLMGAPYGRLTGPGSPAD